MKGLRPLKHPRSGFALRNPSPIPFFAHSACAPLDWQVIDHQRYDFAQVHREVHLSTIKPLMLNHIIFGRCTMGREWRRGEGGVAAEFGFQRTRAGGKERARREDGVCLSAS